MNESLAGRQWNLGPRGRWGWGRRRLGTLMTPLGCRLAAKTICNPTIVKHRPRAKARRRSIFWPGLVPQ
jgi:hypothetical protein